MLSAWLTVFFEWLNARLAGRHWRVWLVVACVASAVLNQLPPYRHTYRALAHGQEVEANLRVLAQQVADPWRAYSAIDNSHPAKMVFRLTLPLLARWLHLSVLELFVLQFVLGALMYYLLATLLARALADRPAAALLTLGLSGTYFGSAFCYDLFGYFDAYCYALLVVVFFTKNRWLIFSLCLVGGFIDERMLLAAPLAVAWYGVAAYGWQGTPAWRYFLTGRAGAVYAAGGTYGALRLWLAAHYHLPTYTGLVGLSALRDNLQHEWLGLGYLFGLKTYWLLPLLLVALLLHRRVYGVLAVVGLCAAPIFVGAALVTDITRSLAYGGPVVVVCASLVGQSCTIGERRRVALVVAALALAMPSYHVLGQVIYQSSVWQLLLKLTLG